jgi:hypothetical protein
METKVTVFVIFIFLKYLHGYLTKFCQTKNFAPQKLEQSLGTSQTKVWTDLKAILLVKTILTDY